jgi:hypothetical protein
MMQSSLVVAVNTNANHHYPTQGNIFIMPTLTKIDSMRGIASGGNLDEAKKLAAKMSPAERQELAASLKAAAKPQTGSAEHRLANIHAAAKSSDPKKLQAYTAAINGLRRLGFEIDRIAASGNAADLDVVMTKLKWSMAERIFLKSNLLAIGAVS